MWNKIIGENNSPVGNSRKKCGQKRVVLRESACLSLAMQGTESWINTRETQVN